MATAGEGEFLIEAAIYLGAAAIAVPLFNRLKLGSIIGFLAAGIVIGPFGLNLLDQEEGVFHVAELGVVLFLFLVGLELSLARLWALRKDIFGFGAAQMVLTAGALFCILKYSGMIDRTGSAAVASAALAFSSTAFALQFMKERGELNDPYGRRAFPILLFQDLAVIPLLAALPFLAGSAVDGGADWMAVGRGVVVVIALILVSRFALDPILRYVASSGSREAFAATALFAVAAIAAAVDWAGLSMALGAFIAGVFLAESNYRHQVQTDLEPFRGLLLGLFFISIGMRIDMAAIFAAWPIVIGGAALLMLVKCGIIVGLARLLGAPLPDALKTGAVLSQGGEFAFVVFSLGVDAALFGSRDATILSAIVTLSMALTPFAMIAATSFARDTEGGGDSDALEGPPGATGHVIIAGFGRMGQIISQVLQPAGVEVTAIDRNPSHIQNAERFGFKIYYGDASRLDVLLTAGAEDARAIILTMDDPDAVNEAVEALRARLPNAVILAVAHDRLHEIKLRPLNPTFVVRETMESSLVIAREALRHASVADPLIEDFIEQFRARDRERLFAQIDSGPEAGKHLMHKRFEVGSS
ncbi:MAG: potassium transporter TrkA [Alphaproteobacteria bacterium]|nr:potassium transporter TrkA [Alphaproteobacteria bacterium]